MPASRGNRVSRMARTRGGQMTTGLIEAVSGVDDKALRMQVTGPLREGASGAPIINEWAQVVGIASPAAGKSFSAHATASFAIKIAAALTFLEAQKIPVTVAPLDTAGLFGPDIAKRAQTFTVQLVCTKAADVGQAASPKPPAAPIRNATVYNQIASPPERVKLAAPRSVFRTKIAWQMGRFVEGDGDVAILRHVSRAQCERACLSQPRCKLVEHFRPSGECGLFSRVLQAGDGGGGDVGVKVGAVPRF